ncbi:lytic transglycosylase domain-containing protein [Sandaracinus amylolyticus]|uniref:Soluble lytic murein transglycosylase n=1 Tax=Sandaracinus amylolyticus TaxID=927083 RepID=A0A0F6W0S3_9BACT|nr:lytic transglycosylase domain-containing protein [Sandaracinus amylolyticus]AKF04575.1 Soluble lytic murein transglycosylase precursor [Sandaracinus amylolyticus]
MRACVLTILVVLSVTSAARAQEVPDAIRPIAAMVRRGDEAGALAALRALPEETRAHPAVRYLEGRLAERTGALDAAIDALTGGDTLPPAILRDARGRRARLLARRGRCDEAEALLAALERPDAIERAVRAECALVRGDLAGAEAQLAREASADERDVDAFALRMALAEAQLRAGHRDRARDTLRALWLERPEHPDAPRAEEAYVAITGSTIEPSVEERVDRAERLSRALLHDDAVRALEGIARPRDRALAARLLHVRGMALFQSRHAYAEAADVLTQAAALPGPTAVADAFHAARARSRAGDDAGAIRAYRALVRRAPQSDQAAEAEYLAAWLELRLGRRTGARAMERFVSGPRAARAPRLAREGAWQLAIDAFRRARDRRAYLRAAARFEAYARMDADVLVRGRGTYWRARALAEGGDRAGAIAAYRQALHVEPLHWYALLARQRLIALGEEPGSPFAREARGDATETTALALPAEVSLLLALGLDRDARERLRSEERALRAQGDLRQVADAFVRIGDANRAYRLTAQHESLARPALRGERWAWEAAYPRAFESAVSEAARAQRLEPELLWGIMRQESAYDPDALSYADAIGLLQMLPSTASRVARGLGVRFEREMLFVPEWNARLGAAYVRGLVDAHGVPLCFAAFNAGGHRVQEWLERAGARGVELDLFVEEIPFDQTRNYVRRVTTHYAHYLYLRDPSRGWPAIELPERVAPR